jgi:hypothetical protein
MVPERAWGASSRRQRFGNGTLLGIGAIRIPGGSTYFYDSINVSEHLVPIAVLNSLLKLCNLSVSNAEKQV